MMGAASAALFLKNWNQLRLKKSSLREGSRWGLLSSALPLILIKFSCWFSITHKISVYDAVKIDCVGQVKKSFEIGKNYTKLELIQA